MTWRLLALIAGCVAVTFESLTGSGLVVGTAVLTVAGVLALDTPIN